MQTCWPTCRYNDLPAMLTNALAALHMLFFFISHLAFAQAAAAASVAGRVGSGGMVAAVESGDLDLVRDYLIHSNFDSSLINKWVGFPDFGTLLHVAARSRNVELCEMLLFFNADVNAIDMRYHPYPHTIDSNMPNVFCCIVFLIFCLFEIGILIIPPYTSVVVITMGLHTLNCASCCCHTTPMSTQTIGSTFPAPAFFIQTCQFFSIVSCS
jgi:hypothetical protein